MRKMENIEKKNISWNKNKFRVCNNNIQLQVFDVKYFLRISVNNNTPRFAPGIDSNLGPQQTLNTSNLWLKLIFT